MMKRWAFRAVLVLLPMFLSLGLGEFMVAGLAPQNLSGSWLEYGQRGYMVNKPKGTARHQNGETVVHYQFGPYHTRGGAIDEEAKKVLVLGDSFTFGWLLEQDQTYVGRLQERADRRFGPGFFQFLNAATGGWGTADYLAYIETLGAEIQPVLIVVFIGFGDFERALTRGLYTEPVGNSLEVEPLDKSAQRSRFKEFIVAVPGYQWLLEHSHLFQLLRNTVVRGLGLGHVREGGIGGAVGNGQDNASSKKSLRLKRLGHALFRRLARWVRDHDTQLLVMTNGWPTIKHRWIKDIMAVETIPFADLRPKVAPMVTANPEKYVIPGDSHPSAEAAGLIADAAWPYLEQALMRVTAARYPHRKKS